MLDRIQYSNVTLIWLNLVHKTKIIFRIIFKFENWKFPACARQGIALSIFFSHVFHSLSDKDSTAVCLDILTKSRSKLLIV